MLAVLCGFSFMSAVYGNASVRQLFEKKGGEKGKKNDCLVSLG